MRNAFRFDAFRLAYPTTRTKILSLVFTKSSRDKVVFNIQHKKMNYSQTSELVQTKHSVH